MTVAKFHDKKLLEAVKANQIFLAKSALASGANPDILDISGEPILHVAAKLNRHEMLKALLDAGADLEARDRDLLTIVRKCVRLGLLQSTQILLDKGVFVDEVDDTGDSLLHNACARGRKGSSFKDIALLLIKKGATLNARNERSETPLHHATRYGGAIMVRAICGAKPDLNARDLDGHTPLHAAAAGIDNEDGLKEFLLFKPDTSIRDRIGQSPLHMIANKSKTRPLDIPMAKALVAAGVDLWLADVDDFTPFDRADAARMQGKEILPDLLQTLKPKGHRPAFQPLFDPKTGKPPVGKK